MLQPTRRTNQIGLTGQQYYGSTQMKKARQPSGANAPQPLANSGIPGTAGTEKLIGLAQPLSGMAPQAKPGKPLAANYYQMPTTPMSQQSKPDMGIFGPPGSSNRTAADEAYNSFKGPTIGKGPSVPNTSGNPNDYLQKLYGGPAQTPEVPKKPELDRWTDMGVDASDYYNMKSGSVSPREWEGIKAGAIQSQRDKFNTISPERQSQLDADVARDRELAANAAADAQRSLGFVGASIGSQTDYLNKQADYYGRRADSAEAELKRQEAGGGLQYRQGSTGFGTPEQGAQAAADLRAIGAADKAKQDAYNAQQDAQFNDWRAKQAQIYGEQKSELGVRDPQQASTDIKSLTGQFASVTRSGQAKGLKFLDFIQNKIDRGELGIGDDAVKIISKNYNHEFSDLDKDRAGMYQQQWGNPLNAARDAYGQKQAAQDEVRAAGMAQRQQIAAQQGTDRAREAKLIAQGLTPAAARAAVGQQNATADFYNQQRLNNQDRLTADILTRQAELAQKDQEDARRYLDRESQRAYDALNPKATGSSKAKQPNAADGSAGSKGTGSKSKAPENPRVSSAVDSLTQDKAFKKSDPSALLSATKHFASQGLSDEEMIQGLSTVFDANLADPETAKGTLGNLAKHANARAKDQGKWSDPAGRRELRYEANLVEHLPAIRLLMGAAGMSAQEFAMIAFPDEIRLGTFDPELPERRQRLIEALGGNPASEE